MNSPMTIKLSHHVVIKRPERNPSTDKQSVHLDHQGSSMKDLVAYTKNILKIKIKMET